MKAFVGIDVGSVSTNIVAIDEQGRLLFESYQRTHGRPLDALQSGLLELSESAPDLEVAGAATTGSGRRMARIITGADLEKNEITAHAVAAMNQHADVRTVLEIGGQDSKIIVLRDGVVSDFAMNTVCAAGTGSFLDQQAFRLGVPVEELGGLALQSQHPVSIAGRCTVFAESDMIHKQQVGHSLPDIVAGLCDALVRNYLANVGKGKPIHSPVLFQGGVAANAGIRGAFERQLEVPVIVPEHFGVMGAIGAALLAREEMALTPRKSSFRGTQLSGAELRTEPLECSGCPNRCEVIRLLENGETAAFWGGRCGKWERAGRREEHAPAPALG